MATDARGGDVVCGIEDDGYYLSPIRNEGR